MFAGIISYIIINTLIVPIFAHLVSPLGDVMITIVRYLTLVLSEVFVLKLLYKMMIRDNNHAAMISAGIGMGFFEVFLTAFQTVLMLGIYLVSIQNGTIEPTLVTMGYSPIEIKELITSITSISYTYLFSFSLLSIVTMTIHILSAQLLFNKTNLVKMTVVIGILYALNIIAPYLGFIPYLICFFLVIGGLIFIGLKNKTINTERRENYAR
ncbi:MAG: hypothetical protein RR624_09720 [Longicatena sp.]